MVRSAIPPRRPAASVSLHRGHVACWAWARGTVKCPCRARLVNGELTTGRAVVSICGGSRRLGLVGFALLAIPVCCRVDSMPPALAPALAPARPPQSCTSEAIASADEAPAAAAAFVLLILAADPSAFARRFRQLARQLEQLDTHASGVPGDVIVFVGGTIDGAAGQKLPLPADLNAWVRENSAVALASKRTVRFARADIEYPKRWRDGFNAEPPSCSCGPFGKVPGDLYRLRLVVLFPPV